MEKPINKRAVIYCRVSTKEQVEEGNSLITQEKICKEYALQNGYEVAEVFVEQGESAKTANRPELLRMLDYCAVKKNFINVVIAYKLDRISRNTDDYSYIRIILKRANVEIKSTSEHFENTPAGRFMENIISNVSQFDNDVRTERSLDGMKEAMGEGRYVWMAPVGYVNIKIGGKSTIAQDSMAPTIYKLFTEIAKNIHSPEEIRIRMTNELLNKQGKPLARSYFYEILKNELYCGWMIKFGERRKGFFNPILTQELFDQVQLVIKHQTHAKGVYRIENEDFPLRRLIKNPEGQKLTGGWAKGRNNKYPYYWFAGKRQMKRAILEEKFSALVNSFRLDEKHFNALKILVRKNLANKISNNARKNELLSSIIQQLKNKQTALIEKNLDGVISNTILQAQLESIEKEMMKVNSELYKISDVKIDYEKVLKIVQEFLIDPFSIWKRAPLRLKIALQWFNFPKGLILENETFRTAEICRIFKEKNTFLSLLSAKGSSREKILNTPEMVIFKEQENVQETQEYFWNSIDKDLQTIAEILGKND